MSVIGLILGFVGHFIVTFNLCVSLDLWFAEWLGLFSWWNNLKHWFKMVSVCLLQSCFSCVLGHLSFEIHLFHLSNIDYIFWPANWNEYIFLSILKRKWNIFSLSAFGFGVTLIDALFALGLFWIKRFFFALVEA